MFFHNSIATSQEVCYSNWIFLQKWYFFSIFNCLILSDIYIYSEWQKSTSVISTFQSFLDQRLSSDHFTLNNYLRWIADGKKRCLKRIVESWKIFSLTNIFSLHLFHIFHIWIFDVIISIDISSNQLTESTWEYLCNFIFFHFKWYIFHFNAGKKIHWKAKSTMFIDKNWLWFKANLWQNGEK